MGSSHSCSTVQAVPAASPLHPCCRTTHTAAQALSTLQPPAAFIVPMGFIQCLVLPSCFLQFVPLLVFGFCCYEFMLNCQSSNLLLFFKSDAHVVTFGFCLVSFFLNLLPLLSCLKRQVFFFFSQGGLFTPTSGRVYLNFHHSTQNILIFWMLSVLKKRGNKEVSRLCSSLLKVGLRCSQFCSFFSYEITLPAITHSTPSAPWEKKTATVSPIPSSLQDITSNKSHLQRRTNAVPALVCSTTFTCSHCLAMMGPELQFAMNRYPQGLTLTILTEVTFLP